MEPMAYTFGNGLWSGVFAVPNAIVDQHIKLCNPLSLKILLLLLRAQGQLTVDNLAELLGQTRTDVQDALNYWVMHGIIGQGNSLPIAPQTAPEAVLRYTVTPEEVPAQAPVAPAPTEPEERKVVTITQTRPRLSTQEINDMAAKNDTIGHLLQETQQIMGDILPPIFSDLIVGLYSYYDMSPDLILMLVQYCVSIGKKSVRFIEKVAANWLEQGIDSHEKAEAQILRAMQQSQMENRVKTAFGIYDRTLVLSEKKFIATWVDEFHFDLPLIQLAFERTVETKGKLSFAYINGILSNWHQKGLTTPQQALQDMAEGKKVATTGREAGKTAASYDISALENMLTHGDLGK